jgi:hypothetical protein
MTVFDDPHSEKLEPPEGSFAVRSGSAQPVDVRDDPVEE